MVNNNIKVVYGEFLFLEFICDVVLFTETAIVFVIHEKPVTYNTYIQATSNFVFSSIKVL